MALLATLTAGGFVGTARADDVGAELRAEQGPVASPDRLTRGAGLCCPVPEACPCPSSCIPDPLLRVPCLDDCLDEWARAKEASCFKIGVGAYHWWHLRSEDDEVTYGYPGAEGTYFYYVNGDLTCKGCGCWNFGAHVQVRFRDDTPFRSWFDNNVWLYEAYASASSPGSGTFKAGKIWNRFGLDWDGSFWGNVAYYNGMKLDPEWGVSWEHTIDWTRLSLLMFAQVFLREDEVNGSIQGGDSESSSLIDEELTGIVRVVPTWHLNSNSDLALGVSGLWGTLDAPSIYDDSRFAAAVDVTWTWCGAKLYGEVIWADGVVNEAHYASGGPSDEKFIYEIGGAYTYGPLTARASFSFGEYKNPGATEEILLLGLDVQVASWLVLTIEWQDWDVEPSGSSTIKYEEGWSVVLHWDV